MNGLLAQALQIVPVLIRGRSELFYKEVIGDPPKIADCGLKISD